MKGTAVAQQLKRWPFTQWACIRFLVPRMIGLYIRFLMALMCLQKSLVASGRTSSKIAPVCQKAPLLPAFEREVHNVKRLHFFLMVDWLYTHLHSAVCSVYIVAAKEVRNMQSWKMTEQITGLKKSYRTAKSRILSRRRLFVQSIIFTPLQFLSLFFVPVLSISPG